MTQWSSDYETGISSIDKDHQNLFKQVLELGKHIESGLAPDELEANIHSLILYVDEHFEREERFMKRAGYPDYEAHKQLHDKFKDTIISLSEFQKEHSNELDAKKIVEFLKSWLVDHIIKVDMDYQPYLSGDKQGLKIQNADNQNVRLVNIAIDPEIHDKVQHFIKLITEDTEEGILIETAVEKITENQLKRRKNKAREMFGK